MDYKTEILAGIITIVTGIVSWRLGGKQAAKSQTNDSITSGTDKIVDTSNKLIDRMESILKQEQERTSIEREHRENCESKLKAYEEKLKHNQKEINRLKNSLAALEAQFQMAMIAAQAKEKKK